MSYFFPGIGKNAAQLDTEQEGKTMTEPREVEFAEFTNRDGDEVKIQLTEDSSGAFHLIVKCKRTRRHDETRIVEGRDTKIPTSTFTDETKHVRLPNERSAMIEFKLECALNLMPGFGVEEFQDWGKTLKEEA